jgi:hypothetical protein
MFQPQPTPLSSFASSSPTAGLYGSDVSIGFTYPLVPDLGLDSSVLFPAYNQHHQHHQHQHQHYQHHHHHHGTNPTFRPAPATPNNVGANDNDNNFNRQRRTNDMANLGGRDDRAAQEVAAGQYRPELTVRDTLFPLPPAELC